MEVNRSRRFAVLATLVLMLGSMLAVSAIPAGAQQDPGAGTQTDERSCVSERLDKNNQWTKTGRIALPAEPSVTDPTTTKLYAVLFEIDPALVHDVQDTANATSGFVHSFNGLDAYIIDLGCEVDDYTICVEGDDNGGLHDMAVRYRDQLFDANGPYVDRADSREVCGVDGTGQDITDGTQFVEIITRNGVPGAVTPPLFPLASVEFSFVIELN